MATHHLGPSCCPMSTPLDPLAGPPPNLAQKLAEAALQRQNALLGLGKEAAAPAPMAPPSSTTATASVPPVPTPSLLPPAPPPLPLGASPAPREQVSVSEQARQSLLESAQQRPQAGQARRGAQAVQAGEQERLYRAQRLARHRPCPYPRARTPTSPPLRRRLDQGTSRHCPSGPPGLCRHHCAIWYSNWYSSSPHHCGHSVCKWPSPGPPLCWHSWRGKKPPPVCRPY